MKGFEVWVPFEKGGGGVETEDVLIGEKNWTKLVLVGNVSKKITCSTCTANGSVCVVSVSSKS
jgi:hypothetical protein